MDNIPVVPWYQSRTIITAIVMGVLAILDAGGVFKMDNELADRIIALVLALGSILVIYLRVEPSPPKPLTQQQAEALTIAATKIMRGG